MVHTAEILADEAIKKAIAAEEAKLAGKGRILVRASGTEPVMRVMAEAETPELCHEVVDAIATLIEATEAKLS